MSAPQNKSAHGDFKAKEASRPAFNTDATFRYHQTVDPDWKPGSGANTLATGSSETPKHRVIDPYAEGRPPGNNYKLMISSVVPRPIAFVSTVAADGSNANLAPFSYFNTVCHDPPILVVGFSPAPGADKHGLKDTLANLKDSGGCVVNIISEPFLEAANATAVNAPRGVSEWDVSGLTKVHDCETVKAPRVGEALVSFEGKLDSVKEWNSRAKGREDQLGGTMVTIEVKRVWVREDAVDEAGAVVDPAVLRPISRMGGITYGRTIEGVEIPRMDFEKDLGGYDGLEEAKVRKGTKGGDA